RRHRAARHRGVGAGAAALLRVHPAFSRECAGLFADRLDPSPRREGRGTRDARAMDRRARPRQATAPAPARGRGVTALSYPLRVLQNRVGAVPRPSFCTYLVCNRCNALCQMCDSWKLPKGYELTPEEVAVVFGKIGRLDVVRLTGGEPFLRDDI